MESKILLTLTPNEAKALAIAWSMLLSVTENNKAILTKAVTWAYYYRLHPTISDLSGKMDSVLRESIGEGETIDSDIELTDPKGSIWN